MPDDLAFRPRHRLFAVFGDADQTGKAVQLLVEHGVALEEIAELRGEEGIRQLDLRGRSHGIRGRLVRVFQRVMSADSDYLEGLGEELRAGHVVLVVHAPDSVSADRMARLLRPLTGHAFAYFGHWDFGPVAA